MTILNPKFLFISLFFAAAYSFAVSYNNGSLPPVSVGESQVFEWWDDGLITGAEAEELLGKIQEGNPWEVCHLVEALALESCEVQAIPPDSIKAVPTRATPHGYVIYKSRLDSLGKTKDETFDLGISFYRMNLHLGSRKQLSYRNDGAEAYFGQIASREFHSQIGTDTLWGTAVYYPLGNFRVQAVLDTGFNLQAGFGLLRQGFSVSGFSWYHPAGETRPADVSQVGSASISQAGFATPQASSAGLQLKIPEGEIASWWQVGQRAPLTRIQIHKTFRKKDSLQVSWRTTAYFHGSEIPDQANLSATLQRNRFSGTQAISATFPTQWGDLQWNNRIAANARVFSPLGSDSLKARIKLSAEAGPPFLRGSASWTCLEASTRCDENDINLKWISQSVPDFTFGASIKDRHTRNKGFAPPQTEAFALYNPSDNLSAKISLIFPRGDPQRQTQIRSESFIGNEHFISSLVVTFRCTSQEKIHPIRGTFQLKWLF